MKFDSLRFLSYDRGWYLKESIGSFAEGNFLSDRCLWNGSDNMDYYSMMELGETLDQKFDELVENCMLSGEIDQN